MMLNNCWCINKVENLLVLGFENVNTVNELFAI
jgi:hypothetical protein